MHPLIRIDRHSPKPIFRQLEEQILAYIQTGELKPGDRIPSQYELARECQVSRATVQKALDRLILDEVLYYQQGKGIYVAAPSERQRLPILQSISQSLRELGHEVQADLLLMDEIESSGYVAERLHLSPRAAVIHLKRLQYVDGEPSLLQEAYLDAERFRAVMGYDLRRRGLTEVIREISGQVIKESTLAIGAHDANWEESRLLTVPAGSSLLTIEELDYDEDAQPLRFSRNTLRGDRFRVTASTLQDYQISLEYRLQPGIVNIQIS
jgi:GntR family transcriptional regulator